jgi:glycosyltransferase involved in cell wall biosynthesis
VTLRRPPQALFVTWERHRRTREIARAFGATLLEVTASGGRLTRYARLLARTTWALASRRPDVLFVQCPSIVLGVWCALLKPLFRYRLIADLHNEAVEPFNYSFGIYRLLLRLIRRAADVSLVTNDALETIVNGTGGRAFVLPDKVPDLGARQGDTRAPEGAAQVVFICTFAPDEPVLEVIEAARLLGPRVRLQITGNPSPLKRPLELPPHVTLTGFLDDESYEALLANADVLIDLTRMDNCLVCGAYEAVALQKPLVTSDTRALRRYFRKGAIYARHDPQSLADAIACAVAGRERLAAEMQELERELRDHWAGRGHALAHLLQLEVR